MIAMLTRFAWVPDENSTRELFGFAGIANRTLSFRIDRARHFCDAPESHTILILRMAFCGTSRLHPHVCSAAAGIRRMDTGKPGFGSSEHGHFMVGRCRIRIDGETPICQTLSLDEHSRHCLWSLLFGITPFLEWVAWIPELKM